MLPVARRASIRLLLTCALSLTLLGCGADPNAPLTDEGQLTGIIYHVSDAARSKDAFAELFSAAAAPTDAVRKKYAALNFRPTTEVSIDGDSATLKVLIRDLNDQDLAELDWKASRENGTWKLTEAPLPK